MWGPAHRAEHLCMTTDEPTATRTRHATTRPLERWLAPTDLERRLEAHLLIARKIRG